MPNGIYGITNTRNKFSPEVRERAARIVGEQYVDCGSEWEAMTSTASKIGCMAETRRRWCWAATIGAGGACWRRTGSAGSFC